MATRDVARVARERLGFESLRPGQREAVESLLRKQDALVVQPTGAGKSAIYQIAGLMIQGATVVISPLIALQKDQVDSINAREEAAEAVVVNSHLRAAEQRETLDKIEEGAVEYIFLAPEQLRKQETIERLDAAGVSLFVVDEAHCISEWGHDFRPDYMQIGPTIERLGHPTVLAMTATATPEVRSEIIERLGMRDPKIFVQGFDRPNIHLRVDHFETEDEKMEAVIKRVRWADKPGIVYVGTRKNAENIMRALREEAIDSLFYHAGLKAKERQAIQDRFMSGDAQVIVATNAFGMGVDKADIRFVYHFDIAGSLDAYYQEVGRAGRDGEKAEAVLFYRNENVGTQKFRTGQGKLEIEQVRRVLQALHAGEEDIAKATGLSARKTTSILHRLEEIGATDDLEDAARRAVEEQQQHTEMRRERLRQMQEYADTSECRRQYILRYFGDPAEGPCGNCDNCESSAAGSRREVA